MIAGARGAALGGTSPHGGKRTAVLVEIGVGELIASGKARKGHLTASFALDDERQRSLEEPWHELRGRLYRNMPVNTSQSRSSMV